MKEEQTSIINSGTIPNSTGKALQPFWNESYAEMSAKLWSPIGTACAGSALTCSGRLSNRTAEKSWFSTTLSPRLNDSLSSTLFPSFTFLNIENSVSEERLYRPRKIRIYPTASQREILRRFLGISRFTYNKTVEYLQQPGTKADWLGIKKNIIDSLPEWSKETPYQVRSVAVKDACLAVKMAKVQYIKTGKFNKVSFRSKKDVRQSIYLRKNSIGNKGTCPKVLGQMRYSEPLPEIKHDCRLVYEYGKWFVVIPVEIEKPAEARTKLRSVSFDPGVRTFLTGYCEEGVLEIGRGAYEKIMGLCVQYDRMTALMTKVRARRRQNLKRARTRLLYRVECLKKELHWKTATFLAKSFETIVIPEFSAGQMAVRTKRRLVSKTARAMLNLGQSRFREVLSQQCEKYGSRMLVVTEEYTSKTCPSCGQLHEKLGGAEVFRCPHCGYVSPRDANGARNIMLRAMVDSPTLLKQGVTVNIC